MKKLLFILGSISLFSCGTQPQLSELVNDMVVITNFEPEVDFSQYATYALTMDTVGFVSNTSDEDALISDYATLITTQLKRNLDQTNRTQVADSADLGVNVVVVSDLSISQTYYPGGGYGYYPGYYGYGGYGGGFVSTDYFQQAILIVELVDLRNSGQPTTIWSANIGDLVNTYDRSTKTKEAIDQAFVQSPFLDR